MSRAGFSLAAYLTYVRGGHRIKDLPARPDGPLIWVHAETVAQARALAGICARLKQHRPEICVMFSGTHPDHEEVTCLTLPEERLTSCESFVSALAPDVLLWAGQNLRPALLHACRLRGVKMIALGAEDRVWSSNAPRWMPDPTHAALNLFDRIYTTTEAAVRRLRRLGLPPTKARRGGPLLDVQPPLPSDDRTREELATQIAGRPIWLACHLCASEIGDVLQAYRQSVRLAHRLLLIVVPEDETEADKILASAAQAKLRLCLWDQGETLDENTQVLVTEGPEDLGLWYRLSPLVFLGGSLVPGVGGHDPFEAATLGGAILYGPNIGNHLGAYSQLVEAGAARIVTDADSLATAVSHLVAPDLAAAMARAGWDVISSGAELVDTVISDICDHLDEKGA